MPRNLVPKIIIGAIVGLVALHFLFSSVSITHEGSSWRDPKFSFSYTGPKAGPSDELHDAQPEQHDRPPSMWDDWWPTKGQPSHTTPEEPGTIDLLPPAVTSEASPSPMESASPDHGFFQHSEDLVPSGTHDAAPLQTSAHDVHAGHGDETKLPCSKLEGAEDVVFIIKTGATEVEEKIPVHFNTTLRCFPNYLLYSDFGEEFEGHTIHDALGQIVDQIRLDNDDFDLWRRLHENGRSTLGANELSINDHADPNGGGGNPDNGGWRLDKFKNIPMVNYTIHKYPDAKWFVYTDADTYIVWSNLLKWVRQMDSTKLSYLGSPAMIDEQVFGHGGSGYIISNALMKKTAEVYNDEQTKWDEYAANHWAGDCVLATLLEKLGAPLTWSYPVIQGGDPVVMDFWETGYDRRLWCYPAVSYHHIKPATVASLWDLEQEWLANDTTKDLHHSDVYKHWFLPRISNEREGWDNLCEDEMVGYDITNSWECREHCQRNSTCMQWTWKDGVCRTQEKTLLGRASQDVEAGWMVDRIKEHIVKLDKCDEGDWILPDHRRRRSDRLELAAKASRKYK